MVALDVFAHAFGFDEKNDGAWFTLGKVTAVNGSKLSVLLGGSATPTQVESYCTAAVGDVVLVVVSKGQARAIARRGGGSTAEYLPISGGTLTGQLEIPDSAVTDASQTPSANQYGSALHVIDQQGEQVGYLGLVHETNDNLWTQLGVTRDVNGSPAYNSMWLGLKDDGTPAVHLGGSDAQKAWRDALGMDVWGRIVGQASNLTLSTSWQKVPLSSFYGRGCSASSNGIKVAQGGNYWVQGTIYLTTGFTAGDMIHVAIYKNGTLINECRRHVAYANPYETFDVPATILSLSANDVVYIYAYNQNGARGLVQSLYNVGLHLHKVG